jgi:hypothetical protein
MCYIIGTVFLILNNKQRGMFYDDGLGGPLVDK